MPIWELGGTEGTLCTTLSAMANFQNYVLKAPVTAIGPGTHEFRAQKTMYGGKSISRGDCIYVFASENEGGLGLAAKGTVVQSSAVPRKVGVERQTPRVNITVRVTALAKRPLGRAELRPFGSWDDGKPETELNFKFYRQATNKIGGVSMEAAAFLSEFF